MEKIAKSPLESKPFPGAVQHVDNELVVRCLAGEYKEAAMDFIDGCLAAGLDPVVELDIWFAAVRSIARRAAR